jgi:putative MFS transporter
LPDKGVVIVYFFIALSLGDVLGGFVSQWLRSRKKSIYIFLSVHLVSLVLFFTIAQKSVTLYYIAFAGFGLSVGFVIQLFTLAAENFGTNIRTLVTGSGLNLVRGWVSPFGALFTWMTSSLHIVEWKAAAAIAFAVCLLSMWSVSKLDENFGADMDFESV